MSEPVCRGSSTASAAVGKTAASGAAAAPPAKRARPAASAAASAEPAGPADAALSMGSLSREEAEGRLGELFGEAAVAALRSDKWKERLEAMDAILAKVARQLNACVFRSMSPIFKRRSMCSAALCNIFIATQPGPTCHSTSIKDPCKILCWLVCFMCSTSHILTGC